MFKQEFMWPPSVNTYWRRNGNRYYISEKGRKFKNHVFDVLASNKVFFGKDDRLKVTILAYPPDRRRRDLDNIQKGVLDSLEKAGIYHDDSQIDELRILRMPEKLSKIVVTINVINKA